ncbi:UNVERIFIED_CONTAM: hypothetical protein K2H54_021351 [Gekko kuhli]
MGNTTSCCVSSSPKLRRNAHSRLESYRPETELSRDDTGCNLQHISDRENIDGMQRHVFLPPLGSHKEVDDNLEPFNACYGFQCQRPAWGHVNVDPEHVQKVSWAV